MRRIFWAVAAAGMIASCGKAVEDAAPADIAVDFHYEDLDAFAAAVAAIDGGEAPASAFTRYVAGASPAFQFYANRYGATPESIAAQFELRPNYYRRLTTLRPRLEERETEIRAALTRLTAMAPAGAAPPPVYYLVANQTAGGTPAELNLPSGPLLGIAVAIDSIAIAPDVDMSEFPDGPGGRGALADIPQVVVHETVHVYQVGAQGGLENYRSIYNADTGGSNLAVLLREGCAEYLTFLASGWRLGDRHLYAEQHVQELWEEFKKVMNDPPFSAQAFFGRPTPEHPDWPSQIGYALGMMACEAFHKSAGDPDALEKTFAAYRPEHFAEIIAPFAAAH